MLIRIIIFPICLFIFGHEANALNNELNNIETHNSYEYQKTVDDTNLLHDTKIRILNRTIKNNIPRDFNFDQMKIRMLFGMGTDINNLTISENPAFLGNSTLHHNHFAIMREVSVRVAPLPLLLGRIHLKRVKIQNPLINVIRNAKNQFNIDDLFEAGKGPILKWMKVKHTEIYEGKLRYIDETAPRGTFKMVADEITLKANNFSLKKDFDILVAARTPGANYQNFSLQGKAGPLLEAEKFDQVPTNVRFHLKEAPIMPYMRLAPNNLAAYPESGKISIDFAVNGNAWDGLNMQGALNITNVILSSKNNGSQAKPVNLKIDIPTKVSLSLADKKISIDAIDVMLNGNRLRVEGSINDFIANPKIDVSIIANQLNVNQLIEVYPDAKTLFPQGTHYNGITDIDFKAVGHHDNLNAKGKVSLTHSQLILPLLIAKPKGSSLYANFEANLDLLKDKIYTLVDFEMSKAQILQTSVFVNGLRKMRNQLNLTDSQASFLNLNESMPLYADQVSGKVTYNGEQINFLNLKITNLHQDLFTGLDATLAGELNLKSKHIRLTGKIHLTREASEQLVKAYPRFTELLQTGRIAVQVPIEG